MIKIRNAGLAVGTAVVLSFAERNLVQASRDGRYKSRCSQAGML
jgi:hypothetical protein